jgi:hypothetical protein
VKVEDIRMCTESCWKMAGGDKGCKAVFEGIEQKKVKHTTEGIHWDTSLNVNLNINNENQDYKTGTVFVGGKGH